MEEKNINSQVIDLQNEQCPHNLVKFKFYFYKLKTFQAIINKGEASEGIIKFLNHKNANFTIIAKDSVNVFDIK